MKIKTNIMCAGLFLVSVLGLMSCSDSDKKSSGDWGLKAPLFETSDKNEPEKLRSFDRVTSSEKAVGLKPTDKLVFTDASSYEGVSLTILTKCLHSETKNSLTKSTRLPLAPKVSIYELLPIDLLYQTSGRLATQLECNIHIVATNKSGSTHDFGEPIQFVLGAADTSKLIPIESRTSQLPVGHSEGYLGVSHRDSYNVYLPTLAAGQNFWLKCESFQTRTAHAQTLAQVLEQNNISRDQKSDELCRLFVESKGVLKNMSNFFMLMVFNVDNLVDNVEMSSPLLDKSTPKTGFRVATVTFFNKTNKVYYGQLIAPPIAVQLTKRLGKRLTQTNVQLQPVWNVKGGLLVLQPNQTAKVSVRIPLAATCNNAQEVSLIINEQRPLPVIELSSGDPRASGGMEAEMSIPVLEASPIPVAFNTFRGKVGNLTIYTSPNCQL